MDDFFCHINLSSNVSSIKIRCIWFAKIRSLFGDPCLIILLQYQTKGAETGEMVEYYPKRRDSIAVDITGIKILMAFCFKCLQLH